MRVSSILKAAPAIALAATMTVVATADADAKTRWKMQSAFSSSLTQLGTLGKRMVDNVKEMSDGELDIKFFEPGKLVPALQGFEAASAGSVDAVWGAAGYHVGKVPAAAWFTAVPFGPRASEFYAWLKFGGGMDVWRDIYAKHNVVPYACGIIAPEASGWFRKEIKSVDDLKGLKMRFFGLGALVMEKVGVSTQLLAGGDIYPALERGTIDATEFSMPAIDLKLGFYQVAKHYYFPGWHQQSSVLEFMVSKPKLDKLSKSQKKMLDVACGDGVAHGLAEGEAIQGAALATLKEKGVNIHRWPESTIDVFRKGWDQVVAEKSAENADFKRVAESLGSFRAKYKIWKDLGYLN